MGTRSTNACRATFPHRRNAIGDFAEGGELRSPRASEPGRHSSAGKIRNGGHAAPRMRFPSGAETIRASAQANRGRGDCCPGDGLQSRNKPDAEHAHDPVAGLHAVAHDARGGHHGGDHQCRLRPAARKTDWIAGGWQTGGHRRIRSGRLPGHSLLFWCELLLDDPEAGSRDPCRPRVHNLTIRKGPSGGCGCPRSCRRNPRGSSRSISILFWWSFLLWWRSWEKPGAWVVLMRWWWAHGWRSLSGLPGN